MEIQLGKHSTRYLVIVTRETRFNDKTKKLRIGLLGTY